MKIISKFKDYYDYLVGTYGIDEKIVYVRQTATENLRDSSKFENCAPPRPEGPIIPRLGDRYASTYLYLGQLHVCDVAYVICVFDNKIYYGPEIEQLFGDTRITNINDLKYAYTKLVGDMTEDKNPYHTKWYADYRIHGKKSGLNEKYGAPVVYKTHLSSIYLNPKLEDFDFARIVDPQSMYINLSNWLSKEKPIENKMTDKEKITSHGFDLKTSFRNIK